MDLLLSGKSDGEDRPRRKWDLVEHAMPRHTGHVDFEIDLSHMINLSHFEVIIHLVT